MSIVLAVALAAAAPSPAAVADARCISLFSFMSAKGTAEQKQVGMLGATFFLGKLKGRGPGLDLERTLAAAIEGAKTGKIDVPTELKRCDTERLAAMKSMIVAGRAAEASALPPATSAPSPRKP